MSGLATTILELSSLLLARATVKNSAHTQHSHEKWSGEGKSHACLHVAAHLWVTAQSGTSPTHSHTTDWALTQQTSMHNPHRGHPVSTKLCSEGIMLLVLHTRPFLQDREVVNLPNTKKQTRKVRQNEETEEYVPMKEQEKKSEKDINETVTSNLIEFKVMIIKKLRSWSHFEEKWMNSFILNKERENIRKYPTKVTQLKNTISELEDIQGRYNSRLDESKVWSANWNSKQQHSSRRNRKEKKEKINKTNEDL